MQRVHTALSDRHGLPRLLAGTGAALDTTSASGRLIFGVPAALAASADSR